MVNKFKYLGVTFTHNGSFKQFVLNLKGQAKRVRFLLIAKRRKVAIIIIYSLPTWQPINTQINADIPNNVQSQYVIQTKNIHAKEYCNFCCGCVLLYG